MLIKVTDNIVDTTDYCEQVEYKVKHFELLILERNCSQDSRESKTWKFATQTPSSTVSKDAVLQTSGRFYTIELFVNDDKGLHSYTGLECYAKFKAVFATLSPEPHSLKYHGKFPI